MLTIGKLAKQANLNVETIRYYQRIGLMRTPDTISHYRYYNDQDIETLKSRALLIKKTGEVLKEGLSLLGIPVLNKM